MMSGNAHSVGALLCGLEGPVKCGTVRMEAVRFTLGVRRLNTRTWSSVKAKSTTSNWPKLLRISEEMRQWSAMLEQDLREWPRVTSLPMFGLIGFYRDGVIFAALPRTRALVTPHSFIVKVYPMPLQLLLPASTGPR